MRKQIRLRKIPLIDSFAYVQSVLDQLQTWPHKIPWVGTFQITVDVLHQNPIDWESILIVLLRRTMTPTQRVREACVTHNISNHMVSINDQSYLEDLAPTSCSSWFGHETDALRPKSGTEYWYPLREYFYGRLGFKN